MYSVNINQATKLILPKRNVFVFVGAEAYKSQKLTMGKTVVDPGVCMDPHIHELNEEIIFVTSGQGMAKVGGIDEELLPNTAVVFPAGVEHSVSNTGDAPLEFVFMFNPTYNFNNLI